ncbi:MAG: T9SS type A sorting domain-containing protein, partial [Saprospiraceae bacterium]
GNSFTFRPFPVLQFYTSEIDFQNPDILYGGLQDNGTWRSTVQDPFTWDHIYGGDGFVCLVNPNNGTWYAEYQYGNMGGSNGASSPNSSRSNWNSPYVFDPQNPSIMYFGKDRLFKSTNSGFSWTPISQDLSNGNSGAAGVVYGTITSIAVSPANSQVIWAGTDDGNVWVSANGGSSWDKVSDNLPQRWVTRITADYTEAGTAYLCLSGFKNGENMAHIYKTTDYGLNWAPVDGNLPDIPVNDLIIDPLAAGNLVIATDIGVFNSADDGATWSVLGTGLPNVPYLDLTFHAPTRKLVAASYGRSMFSTSLPFVSNTAIATHDQEMHISPNPCTDRVTIQWNEVVKKDQQLRVWSADGKLIQSIPVFAGTDRLEMLTIDWAKGSYFLRFGNQSQTIIKN